MRVSVAFLRVRAYVIVALSFFMQIQSAHEMNV